MPGYEGGVYDMYGGMLGCPDMRLHPTASWARTHCTGRGCGDELGAPTGGMVWWPCSWDKALMRPCEGGRRGQ